MLLVVLSTKQSTSGVGSGIASKESTGSWFVLASEQTASSVCTCSERVALLLLLIVLSTEEATAGIGIRVGTEQPTTSIGVAAKAAVSIVVCCGAETPKRRLVLLLLIVSEEATASVRIGVAPKGSTASEQSAASVGIASESRVRVCVSCAEKTCTGRLGLLSAEQTTSCIGIVAKSTTSVRAAESTKA